jgi:hypothetical protein
MACHPSVKVAVPVPLRPPSPSSAVARRPLLQCAPRPATSVVAAVDEYPEGILSGEWPENFSLLSYADLRAYLESQIVTSDRVRRPSRLSRLGHSPCSHRFGVIILPAD